MPGNGPTTLTHHTCAGSRTFVPATRPSAGHKAANLGLLAQQGFPVPPRVVVKAGEPDEALPPRVAEALVVLRRRALAVRSSALAEDLADASFAGQYETVLGRFGRGGGARRRPPRPAGPPTTSGCAPTGAPTDPQGTTALRCSCSGWSRSEASGVAFTANPLTGVREETVVTATHGLGEALVGGEAAGEQWVVRDGVAVRDRRAPSRSLGEGQAWRSPSWRGGSRAAFDGVPQDIEWAFADDELYLLQARPDDGAARAGALGVAAARRVDTQLPRSASGCRSR